MAKLPYTWTIVPPNEPPEKPFTASSKKIGRLLKNSPNGDLTINQTRNTLWQSWTEDVSAKPLELRIREMCEAKLKENT
jgi:hypothetical protein